VAHRHLLRSRPAEARPRHLRQHRCSPPLVRRRSHPAPSARSIRYRHSNRCNPRHAHRHPCRHHRRKRVRPRRSRPRRHRRGRGPAHRAHRHPRRLAARCHLTLALPFLRHPQAASRPPARTPPRGHRHHARRRRSWSLRTRHRTTDPPALLTPLPSYDSCTPHRSRLR